MWNNILCCQCYSEESDEMWKKIKWIKTQNTQSVLQKLFKKRTISKNCWVDKLNAHHVQWQFVIIDSEKCIWNEQCQYKYWCLLYIVFLSFFVCKKKNEEKKHILCAMKQIIQHIGKNRSWQPNNKLCAKCQTREKKTNWKMKKTKQQKANKKCLIAKLNISSIYRRKYHPWF